MKITIWLTNYFFLKIFLEPDDIILLGAGVHSMPLVLGEVDQVYPIPGQWTGWTWCVELCCLLVFTFCCWEPASGSLSRSRRWLSGRLHLKLWCSAHHCWGCETSNQESIVGVAWQTCSECLWFAPYCPCTAWPPACWKFEDESDAQLWLCDRIYYFLEPRKRNSMSLRFHVCFIWLSNFATKTCLFKYFYQI